MSTDLSFTHRFEPGNRLEAPPLLLLHGTGGNENDLLPLGKAIAPGSALLSPRGKVLENGLPRFFRRLAEGIFDEDDVRRRANELSDFVVEARQRYNLPALVGLGYSNGANIAAAMMMLRPEALAGAVLLRAMVPLRDAPKADLAGKRVLVVSGQFDPIIPLSNAAALATMLKTAAASVQQSVLPVGHGLSHADITIGRAWLDKAGMRTELAEA